LNGSRVPSGRSFLADARITTGSGARRPASGGREAVPRPGGRAGDVLLLAAGSPLPLRPHPSPASPLRVPPTRSLSTGCQAAAPPPAGPAHSPRAPPPPRRLPPLPALRARARGLEIPPPGPQHGALPRGPAVHQVPAARLQPALLGLYVLVGAGALMMAVGFFGCCGATRESQCVLGSFFTCLLVIFAAEVTTGVFAFIGKDVAIRHVQTMYEEAYNGYLRDREKGNGTLVTFHSTFQCCGKESSEQVQPTCPKELLGHKNCINEIETTISVKLQLIGIVGIGIAGFTILGMIFSMVLCCAIRNSRDVI
uniref:Tetraspanin-2 n=1 Tax=Equus caballus TaxID=9796 RepID=F7C2L7_HORSE